MRFFPIILLIFACSGCHTYYAAKDIGLFSFERQPPEKAESIGVIEGYNCGLRILSMGPGSDLTQAFRNLKETYQPKFMTRLRIFHRVRSYGVVDRDCWIIRGIGYK